MTLSQVQTAAEYPDKLEISSAMTMQELKRYVDETILNLKRTVQLEFGNAFEQLSQTIDQRPFYVLFEPRLGSNTNQDASIARSVLPIFKTDLQAIMTALEKTVASAIEPEIKDLLGKRECQVIQQMTSSTYQASNAKEEAEIMRKQVAYLEAVLMDQRRSKQEQINAMKREIAILREQLFNKSKTNVYRPDFFAQKADENENTMVSQKYLQDQLTELQLQFAEERRNLERRNQTQQAALTASLLDAQAGCEQLRTENVQLTSELRRRTEDLDAMKASLEDSLHEQSAQHQKEMDDFIRKTQKASKESSQLLAEKDARIADLDARLSQFSRLAQASKEELDALRVEYERQQKEKDQLVISNQQLLKLSERDEELAAQVKAQQDELMMHQMRAEQLEKQIMELSAAKKQLKEELDALAARPVSTGNDTQEFQQLIGKAKKEFDMVRELVQKMTKSLFESGFGSLSKLIMNSLGPSQINDVLRLDVGAQLWTVGQQYFRPELDLINAWGLKYAQIQSSQLARRQRQDEELRSQAHPQESSSATTQQVSQQPSQPSLLQTATTAGVKSPPIKSPIVLSPRQQPPLAAKQPPAPAQAKQEPTPKEVQALLITDGQQVGKRVSSAGSKERFDMGVNTAVCASADAQSLPDGEVFCPRESIVPAVMQSFVHAESQTSRPQSAQLAQLVQQFAQTSRPPSGTVVETQTSRPASTQVSASALPPKRPQAEFASTQILRAELPASGAGQAVLSREQSATVKCPNCRQDGVVLGVELIGANEEKIGKLSNICGGCGVAPTAEMSCPDCGQSAQIGGVKIQTKQELDETDQEDGDVEYIYRQGDRATRPQSGKANRASDARSQLEEADGAPADEQSLSLNAPDFSYTCPHCQKTSAIAHVDLTSIPQQLLEPPSFQQPFVARQQPQRFTFTTSSVAREIPRQRIEFKPKPVTVFETVGVFDRLLLKAKEIELRQKRRRDLFLRERTRTMERVLRAMSLFVDSASVERPVSSLYQTQSSSGKIINMRSSRPETGTPSARSSTHISYVQAVMQVTPSRPESAHQRPSSASGVFVRKQVNSARPQPQPATSRQDNVLQLLAASKLLHK